MHTDTSIQTRSLWPEARKSFHLHAKNKHGGTSLNDAQEPSQPAVNASCLRDQLLTELLALLFGLTWCMWVRVYLYVGLHVVFTMQNSLHLISIFVLFSSENISYS